MNRPVALEIHASVATNTGCVRTENQDAAVFSRPPGDRALDTHGVIAVVADGWAAARAAEVASALACEKIPANYFGSAEPIPAALRSALEAANAENLPGGAGRALLAWHGHNGGVARHRQRPGLAGLRGRQPLVPDAPRPDLPHVGRPLDGVRDGPPRLITREEARNHQDRNVLSRALGSRAQVEVSCWDEPFPIQARRPLPALLPTACMTW